LNSSRSSLLILAKSTFRIAAAITDCLDKIGTEYSKEIETFDVKVPRLQKSSAYDTVKYKSLGQALRVSLVKPGAYLSASYCPKPLSLLPPYTNIGKFSLENRGTNQVKLLT
jgi:hypothetical protein